MITKNELTPFDNRRYSSGMQKVRLEDDLVSIAHAAACLQYRLIRKIETDLQKGEM
jgi:hypothetical protein